MDHADVAMALAKWLDSGNVCAKYRIVPLDGPPVICHPEGIFGPEVVLAAGSDGQWKVTGIYDMRTYQTEEQACREFLYRVTNPGNVVLPPHERAKDNLLRALFTLRSFFSALRSGQLVVDSRYSGTPDVGRLKGTRSPHSLSWQEQCLAAKRLLAEYRESPGTWSRDETDGTHLVHGEGQGDPEPGL